MQYFPDVEPIRFEGPNSDSTLSFRHYDADKLILDYPEEDPVTLFAVVHSWHTASQSIRDHNSTATMETVNER